MVNTVPHVHLHSQVNWELVSMEQPKVVSGSVARWGGGQGVKGEGDGGSGERGSRMITKG